MQWESYSHPISDVRDWNDSCRLELRPDFQRNEVWSKAAQIMLIDTIIWKNIRCVNEKRYHNPQKNPSARWRLKGWDEVEGKCRLRP